VVNVTLGPIEDRILTTGLHKVRFPFIYSNPDNKFAMHTHNFCTAPNGCAMFLLCASIAFLLQPLVAVVSGSKTTVCCPTRAVMP